MNAKIDGVNHKIVYIEYHDGIPFSIVTIFYVRKAVGGAYWRHVQWDCFLECGNENDLRLYESGSGGSFKLIPAPRYLENSSTSYWMDDSFLFIGQEENIEKENDPLIIKTRYGRNSKNPFTNGEITFSNEYCDKCQHHSSSFCTMHKYDDDEGNERWVSDDTLIEI